MTEPITQHIGAAKPRLMSALLASLLVHVLVLLVLFFVGSPTPLPETTPIEASFIDGNTLFDIQTQLAGAHAAKQVLQQSQQTTPAATPTTSYNDDIAERERAYQAQMQQYADNLEQQMLSEMRLQKQRWDEADQERQRQVDELQRRERSNDDIAQQNNKELNKARERIEQTINEAKNTVANQTAHASDGDGAPSTPTVGRGGKIGKTGDGTSSASRTQAQASIASRVQAIWERYDNPPNRRLSATISIDEVGNLQNVRFGAGDKDLEPSLQASIKEAAPFPEMAGIAKTFTINFSTK